MRGRALLVSLALALAAPAASAASPHAAHSARVSCPKTGLVAMIGGKRTCLAPGRACAARYGKQYRHKGFTCRNGTLRKIKQQF